MLSSPAELSERPTLAPTLTVMVAAEAETAPKGSTTLKLKVASPSNVATGSNFSFEFAMSDREIVCGTVNVVSASLSVPCVPAVGRLVICTSLKGSPSVSEIGKFATRKV